jgi:hypothetical protein
MKKFLAVSALLALAACEAPAPRPDTAGEAARAKVDELTKVYGDCVDGKAKSLEVKGVAAGSLALDILAMCEPDRAALAAEVAAFHKIGNPKETDAMAAAVADASVKTIDDEVRRAAVVTIIQRQGEPAPATAATPPATSDTAPAESNGTTQ